MGERVIEVKMAKATQEDIDAVLSFFKMLEEIEEYGTYTDPAKPIEEFIHHIDTDEQLGALVREHWGKVSCSWSRVVWGCDMLIKNCCDPDKDYLDYNPELKKLIEDANQASQPAPASRDVE